jgi:hypothetical protein
MSSSGIGNEVSFFTDLHLKIRGDVSLGDFFASSRRKQMPTQEKESA